MKKRTLCLLLVGVMALSLLSGCGGKPATGQPNTPDNSPVETGGNIPDNVPNNEAPMVPPDDWEDPSQPDDDLPFPRDPRWDELKPGETAVQYYDIFIRSGMTLDEVVEAVEGSEAYKDQFITWELNKANGMSNHGNYSDLDNVIEVGSTFAATYQVKITSSNGQETISEKGTHEVPTGCSVQIKCDGKTVMYACFFGILPGAKDETYRVGDLPVFMVTPGRDAPILSSLGWVDDLKTVDKDTVEGLLDVFKARDLDTEMVSERKSYDNGKKNVTEYTFYSQLSFSTSWNGYSLWYCPVGGEPVRGVIPTWSRFQIDATTGAVYETFRLDSIGGKDKYYLYWAADDAG